MWQTIDIQHRISFQRGFGETRPHQSVARDQLPDKLAIWTLYIPKRCMLRYCNPDQDDDWFPALGCPSVIKYPAKSMANVLSAGLAVPAPQRRLPLHGHIGKYRMCMRSAVYSQPSCVGDATEPNILVSRSCRAQIEAPDNTSKKSLLQNKTLRGDLRMQIYLIQRRWNTARRTVQLQ